MTTSPSPMTATPPPMTTSPPPMTTPPTAVTSPELLQIKLSAQQRRDFTACAQMCGLELAAWIVQCADVKAADAIDALQAEQRTKRPSPKPHKPRLHAETPGGETSTERAKIKNQAAKDRPSSSLPAKNPVPRPAVGAAAPKGTTSPVTCPAVETTASKEITSPVEAPAPQHATDPGVSGTGAKKPPKRARSSGAGRATSKKASSSETGGPLPKKATLLAARTYNERFRRKLGASTVQHDDVVR